MSAGPSSPPTASQAQLLALAGELRPELHRYCARLMGSVIEGEDVVQDTFARALVALAELEEAPQLRPWLFRIAHNRAMDLLRSRAIRAAEPIEAAQEVVDPDSPDPAEVLMRREAVETAVSRFVELPTVQRSVVILKDVLDQSLEEIADMLDLTVNAVKAHLARGRARLKAINAQPPAQPAPRAAVTRRGPLCRPVQPARLGRAARDAGRRRAADPVDVPAACRRRRRGDVLWHLRADARRCGSPPPGSMAAK